MTLKTLLVVFLLVQSVGFSVSLKDFLNVSLLDEGQDNQDTPSFLVDSVVITWMEKPPYVMFDKEPLEKKENRTRLASSQPGEAMNATNDNSGINQESVQGSSPGFRVKGIFQEIVYKGLQICTDIPLTKVNFAEKADNLRQLDEIIVKKEADLALPVQGSEDGSYGGHTYVEVLKSPGVVFIVDKQQTLKHLRKRVLQAMKDTWPVITLTLLLAGFAGILIWGLDTSKNPGHFPRSFTRGVMEGIWWSFVSMTTVGYGDRTPKSPTARVFGILWILTGLILCSFFTATFTSALTSSSMLHRKSLLGVKVAVLEDSHAYEEALKQAANVKDYPNFHEMYNALVVKEEVEGILADIYTASFYMDKVEDSRLAVTMFLSSQQSIGFALEKEEFENQTNCLRNLFKYRQRDIKKIIFRHTQALHTETRSRQISDKDADRVLTLLDGNSPGVWIALPAMLTTFIMLLTAGFVYETCAAKCRKKRLRSKCKSSNHHPGLWRLSQANIQSRDNL
ncbi:hypothetical protein ABFA07_015102 [Porites harrisoni]